MNFGIVLYVQSILILFIGFFEIFPLMFSLYYGENDMLPFIESIGLTMLVGVILNLLTKRYRKTNLKARESFAIVTFGWITAALFATIPFMLHSYYYPGLDKGVIHTFTDAYFEMMSGFTTTGATILLDIESFPHGLLFWRSLSHWLGGMGIIVLVIAILPTLGIGGMQLYQAEVPGPVSEKISPRISQTAKILWGVYVIFTIVQTISLMIVGLDFFDAICHSFSTIATGGFSIKNESIGHYDAIAVEAIVIFFMILSGTSFALHYRVLIMKERSYLKDREFRIYIIAILIVSVLVLLTTLESNYEGDILKALRYIIFQVVSIITTTGLGVGLEGDIYHYGVWAAFGQFLILILMFTGGCAGSTSGGIKLMRIYLLFKYVYIELVKFIYPRHIKLVRVGRQVVADSVLLSTLGFIMLHMIVLIIAVLILNYFENDLVESFVGVLATLNNIGPGIAKIGPDGNYGHITDAGKWLLTFCMLLGRLEFYGVLILFFPFAWEKERSDN